MESKGPGEIHISDRIIEVAPSNLDLAHWCIARGYKYLGLVPHDRPDLLEQRTDGDLQVLATMSSIGDITANNADVLILNPPYHGLIWEPRVTNARILASMVRGRDRLDVALAAALVRRRRSRRLLWGGKELWAVDQTVSHGGSARRYLSPAVGVSGLPTLLDNVGVRYAVLRWFDELPHIETGEDLDILVADHDLNAMIDVLDASPGTIPCDVYSESGLPGADYYGMAYYTPKVAEALLRGTERHGSGYLVPKPREYFRSLAFHAVYHKGERSGLPTNIAGVTVSASPEHDYAGVLAALAQHDQYSGPITMEALDDHLAAVEWQPSRDALSRLAERNDWLRSRHFPPQSREDARHDDGAMVTFVLRQRAGDGGVAAAMRVLDESGFEVLDLRHLDHEARTRCAREMRGGNWGPGPYATNGGPPFAMIVAIDRRPQVPNRSELERYPGLTNANIVRAKEAIRSAIGAGLSNAELYNPVHSSDNEADAWAYIALGAPREVQRLQRMVAERRPEIMAPSSPAEEEGKSVVAPRTTPRRLASRLLRIPRRARAFAAYRLAKWRLAQLPR